MPGLRFPNGAASGTNTWESEIRRWNRKSAGNTPTTCTA